MASTSRQSSARAPTYRVHEVKALERLKPTVSQVIDQDVQDVKLTSEGYYFVTLENGKKRIWNKISNTLEKSRYSGEKLFDAIGFWVRLTEKGEVVQEGPPTWPDSDEQRVSFPSGTSKIVKLIATDSIYAALSEDGQVFTWSAYCGADHPALGRSTENTSKPGLVILPRITQICGKSGFVVALSEEGNVYTWGICRHGVLGHGVVSRPGDKERPCMIQFFECEADQIFCGPEHVLVLTKTGRLFAWGRGDKSQLGTGHSSCTARPKPLGLSVSIRELACGDSFVLALTKCGKVYAW